VSAYIGVLIIVVAVFLAVLAAVVSRVLRRVSDTYPTPDAHRATYTREVLCTGVVRWLWQCSCASYGYTATEERARERFARHCESRNATAGVS
jgi:hypothetical protein